MKTMGRVREWLGRGCFRRGGQGGPAMEPAPCRPQRRVSQAEGSTGAPFRYGKGPESKARPLGPWGSGNCLSDAYFS